MKATFRWLLWGFAFFAFVSILTIVAVIVCAAAWIGQAVGIIENDGSETSS